MSNTAKYNRRAWIRGWGAMQNDIGSPVAVEVAAWEMWCNVEDRSGFQSEPYEQGVWQYKYRIRLRYERTRLIGSNYTIDYDGKRLAITSLSIKNEAYRAELVIDCIAVDDQTGTGGGGSMVPLPAIGVYNYTGIGDEDEFTASELAGKYVFSASKDNLNYKILREIGIPVGNQVLNTKATGRMKWGNIFTPEGSAIVLYI